MKAIQFSRYQTLQYAQNFWAVFLPLVLRIGLRDQSLVDQTAEITGDYYLS